VIVDLVPGSIPRYAMPRLFGDLVVAMTFCEENLRWPLWLGGKSFSFRARQNVILAIVALACVAMWVYAIAIVPKLDRRQRIRRLAAQVNQTFRKAKLFTRWIQTISQSFLHALEARLRG